MPTRPKTTKQKNARARAASAAKRTMLASEGIVEGLVEAGLNNDQAITAQCYALRLTMRGVVAQSKNPRVRKAVRYACLASLQHLMLELAAPRVN